MSKDRAAAFTADILTIVGNGFAAWLLGGEPVDVRAQVEAFVRDELNAAGQQDRQPHQEGFRPIGEAAKRVVDRIDPTKGGDV